MKRVRQDGKITNINTKYVKNSEKANLADIPFVESTGAVYLYQPFKSKLKSLHSP